MNTHLKIVRSNREIALVSEQHGRAFVALLVVETLIFACYFGWLSTVAVGALDLLVPLAACLAVMVWTAWHISWNARLSLDLAERRGRIVHISPFTGRRTSKDFPLDEVSGVALRQLGAGRTSGLVPCDYAVALALHDGESHEFRIHGPRLSCRSTLENFFRSAGVSAAVVQGQV